MTGVVAGGVVGTVTAAASVVGTATISTGAGATNPRTTATATPSATMTPAAMYQFRFSPPRERSWSDSHGIDS